MDLATDANPTGPRACCANLRRRGMFIDVEPDLAGFQAQDGFCWCSLTMTCLGPDGRVADEARCGGGRGCFETL
jgi:hypothetical protein